MKNLLLIICCLLMQSVFLQAQDEFSHFGVGYYLNFGNPIGLDQFVQRYNANRGAEQGIDNFNLHGWEVGFFSDLNSDKSEVNANTHAFSTMSQYSYYEIGYFQSRKAQSLELANNFQEDLRIRLRGLYLGGGTSFMNLEPFQLLAGFRTYIGLMKGHSRLDNIDAISSAEWNEVFSDLYVDISLGLKIKYRNFWLEPYYVYGADRLLERMIADSNTTPTSLESFYENMNVPAFGAETYVKLKGFGLRFHVGF